MENVTALALVLWPLFFSSVMMAVAMLIAWSRFGHPRHALSWSFAFGLSAVQSLINAAAVIAGKPAWLMVLAFLLVIAPSPFVAMGARQRAGLPQRKFRFAAAAAVVAVFMAVTALIPAIKPFSYPSATLFSAIALLDAACALWPRGRRPEAAEWAMIAAIGLLALVEAITAFLTCAYLAHPGDARISAIYRVTMAIAVPPAVVGSGVAAILLVASDLAAKLRALAANDPLTGVLNRRGFTEGATRAIANGRRHHLSLAVAVVDIDHFKSINDRFGHTAGDRTLLFICARLAGGLRQGDLVGRIGGEEFALLLVDSNAEQAAEAMERIRAEIAGGHEEGASVPVTASFGVAAVASGGGAAEELLADALDRADRALYRSKIDGRNRTTRSGSTPVPAQT